MANQDIPARIDAAMEEWLKAEMRPGDATPELLMVTRIAVLVHEYAFCFDVPKATHLRSLGRMWELQELPCELESDAFFEECKDKVPSRLIAYLECGLLVGRCRAAGVPKDAFMEYLGTAWDAGIHQKRVERCEVEGSLTSSRGIAMNFACHLHIFGKQRGLFPDRPSVSA